jgi:hypothetical protein
VGGAGRLISTEVTRHLILNFIHHWPHLLETLLASLLEAHLAKVREAQVAGEYPRGTALFLLHRTQREAVILTRGNCCSTSEGGPQSAQGNNRVELLPPIPAHEASPKRPDACIQREVNRSHVQGAMQPFAGSSKLEHSYNGFVTRVGHLASSIVCLPTPACFIRSFLSMSLAGAMRDLRRGGLLLLLVGLLSLDPTAPFLQVCEACANP